MIKKGNKENSNVIVIKRNSFSRVTERGESAGGVLGFNYSANASITTGVGNSGGSNPAT